MRGSTAFYDTEGIETQWKYTRTSSSRLNACRLKEEAANDIRALRIRVGFWAPYTIVIIRNPKIVLVISQAPILAKHTNLHARTVHMPQEHRMCGQLQPRVTKWRLRARKLASPAFCRRNRMEHAYEREWLCIIPAGSSTWSCSYTHLAPLL